MTRPEDHQAVRDLPCAGPSVREARRFLGATLTAWGVVAGVADCAILLTSELMGNAVKYGRGRLTIALDVNATLLHIGVTDDEPRPPTVRLVDARSESGRGMWLVDNLSSRWGTLLHPGDGKTVWFELDLAPSVAPV